VAVTPSSTCEHHRDVFESALRVNGVFCAATHYWELETPSRVAQPPVGEQVRRLVDRALSNPNVHWRSVGEVVSHANDSALLA
jgi:hypothetical protein